ncbi:hypothetical protein pipiens_019834, partial [Culex pipiens pipiens]
NSPKTMQLSNHGIMLNYSGWYLYEAGRVRHIMEDLPGRSNGALNCSPAVSGAARFPAICTGLKEIEPLREPS